MTTREFIAEKQLHAVAPDGREFALHLGIGPPYLLSETEWACPVSMQGLYASLCDMHGVDAWQTMQLAYQLMFQLLSHFVENGGQLYWEIGGDKVSSSELFPQASAF